MSTSSLTPKQLRFCEEYAVDLNATQAYKRAGFRAKTDASAAVLAHRLLRNARVRAEVEQRRRERELRTGVTADLVLTELAYIAFSDIGEVLDFSGTDWKLRPVEDIPDHAR